MFTSWLNSIVFHTDRCKIAWKVPIVFCFFLYKKTKNLCFHTRPLRACENWIFYLVARIYWRYICTKEWKIKSELSAVHNILYSPLSLFSSPNINLVLHFKSHIISTIWGLLETNFANRRTVCTTKIELEDTV